MADIFSNIYNFIIISNLNNKSSKYLFLTAIAITLLAFSSATQDISIDAYRIETAPQYMQGPLSSMYIAGYRVAMLVGGAGSLWLAAYFGQESYNQSVWKKYIDYVYFYACFITEH